jgi:hypothetical protein
MAPPVSIKKAGCISLLTGTNTEIKAKCVVPSTVSEEPRTSIVIPSLNYILEPWTWSLGGFQRSL